MADHDVSLYCHSDDEPHREIAHRVSHHVCQLADPVRLILQIESRQLANPEPQQPDVEDQGVGNGEHHEVEVGGELQHRLPLQDDEGENVSERSQDDQDRWHVQ